ncbi:MAG: AbrB family transcriptional regulator [Nitratireductor sp.]|nr:AbrB family transcriptional regulator [Nitratireductor sp.]
MLHTTLLRARTLAIAALGAALFWFANLPLPFLFGPMTACLVAALAGLEFKGFGPVSVGARSILGVAAGAAVTTEVVARIPDMIATVALVPLYIILIGAIGVPFFRRLGYDRMTSWYAAMPGGLQDMILFGQEAGADVRALSLIHATRVLIIVTIAPVMLVHFYDVSLNRPIGEPAATLPPFELAAMAAAALIGWKGGQRLGLFGAAILGPLLLTTILSLTGIIHHRPPREAILFAQFVIGIGIGVSYVGVTLQELRRFVASGIAFVVLLAGLAAAFTEVIHLLGLAGPVEAFLAFAPGGQAEMIVLAIVSGADIGYVIVHHLTRLFLVILGAPIASRLVFRS